MKFPKFNKDFCLWIVPSSNGSVKKLRITAVRALAVISLFVLVFATLVVVAGDYSRVQMLSAKSHMTLRRLTEERDILVNNKENLTTEVEAAKSLTDKVITYQQGVAQRVAALKSVLESASALGVIDQEEFAKVGAIGSHDGIGGAEIDCQPGDSRCEPEGLQAKEDIASLVGEPLSKEDERDLQLVLDGYLNLVEQVPFGLPANGYVSSGWGRRFSPFSRRMKMHQGIDFSVGSGDYVRTAADGVVKSVKKTSTYGLVIDVKHGNGTVVTRYAHMSKALVKPGEKVCRDEAIGLIGSTGRSTGPHLHFEVRINNKPHNPMKFFALGRELVESF